MQKIDLRVSFIDKLIELAARDERIVLIVPDVGFKHADRFKERFSKRYFNLGVTEQSTMVIAAGLALSGLLPVVYSMRNFVLYRPYEQVRNAVVQHGTHVLLAGVSGSAAYAFLGFSHNDIFDGEDVATAERLGLRSYTPTTVEEVVAAIANHFDVKKPSYIRL